MANITIDDVNLDVADGISILDAARSANIYIPTLCNHPDFEAGASCRLCMVDVEGSGLLKASCKTTVQDGMVIHTNTKKVTDVRDTVMELLIAHHPLDCLYCFKSGSCDLQSVAQKLNFTQKPRFEYRQRSIGFDYSSPSITRDPDKCIDCGLCEEVCSEVQSVFALSKTKRGSETVYMPVFSGLLAESPCINCGQCVQVCPVGAITVEEDIPEVQRAIADTTKEVVAQVAPSVRVTIGEALGEEIGTVTTGKVVTALKMLGVDTVFDTNVSADLTIMEEGTEFIHRLQNGGTLPMITSCCPGWVQFAETYFPDMLDNLSSCKSPQGMFGAVIKSYYAEKTGKVPEDIYSLSIMPCTAKKFEAQRPELGRDGDPDIDGVLTVQELAKMIKSAGIDFKNLPETEFDAPFGLGTGAGQIFGASGGVMEAALRTVTDVLTGETMNRIDFMDCRGLQGIKEATITIGELNVKIAIANGLANARKLLEAVKAGEADYQFVEIMACPGGCIGGGGNPKKTNAIMKQRIKAIYDTDRSLPLRKSHKSPALQEMYATYMGEPNGPRAHKLLHTTFHDRTHTLNGEGTSTSDLLNFDTLMDKQARADRDFLRSTLADIRVSR